MGRASERARGRRAPAPEGGTRACWPAQTAAATTRILAATACPACGAVGGFRPHSPYRRNLEDLEDGAIACRVVKPEENTEPDVATYARLAGSDFHNGIIEVDVRARLIHWADVDCRGC